MGIIAYLQSNAASLYALVFQKGDNTCLNRDTGVVDFICLMTVNRKVGDYLCATFAYTTDLCKLINPAQAVTMLFTWGTRFRGSVMFSTWNCLRSLPITRST